MASTLPPEILRSIFESLREEKNSSLSTITPFLTVSRSWGRAARSAIWNHVVLDQTSIRKFIANFPEQGPVEEILSLTVYLKDTSQVSSARLEWQAMDLYLKDLARLLPRMTHMLAFSFYVPSYRAAPDFNIDHTSHMWGRDLGPLLRALPSSVVHLELETNEFDNVMARNSRLQLCDDIRTILPRLHNLRLSLRFVCDRVFKCPETGAFVRAPDLETLAVSFCPRGGFARRVMPRRECHCHGSSIGGVVRPVPPVPRMVSSLRDACAAGSFPRASKVEVGQFCFVESWEDISITNSNPEIPADVSPRLNEFGRRFFKNMVVVRDCLRDQTWIIPIMRLFGHSQETFVFHRNFRRFVNKWWVSMDVAEGVVWGKCSSGARLPLGMASYLLFAGSKALHREGHRQLPQRLPTGINWGMNSEATGFLPQVMVEQGADIEVNRANIRKRIYSHWPPPAGSLTYPDP